MKSASQRLLILIVAVAGIMTAAPLAASAAGTPASVGGWSGEKLAVTIPPQLPIYTCSGLETAENNGGAVQAQGYAQCDYPMDLITFSWQVFDAKSGGLLFATSGQQNNSTFLSTGETVNVGSPGQRNVEVCWTTYLAGYTTSGNCSTGGQWVYGV